MMTNSKNELCLNGYTYTELIDLESAITMLGFGNLRNFIEALKKFKDVEELRAKFWEESNTHYVDTPEDFLTLMNSGLRFKVTEFKDGKPTNFGDLQTQATGKKLLIPFESEDKVSPLPGIYFKLKYLKGYTYELREESK